MQKRVKMELILTAGFTILMTLSLILSFLFEIGTFEFYFWYLMYMLILFVLGNIVMIILGKALISSLKEKKLQKKYIFFKKIKRVKIVYINFILVYLGFILLAGGLISNEIISIFFETEVPVDLFIFILSSGFSIFLLSTILVGIFNIEEKRKQNEGSE